MVMLSKELETSSYNKSINQRRKNKIFFLGHQRINDKIFE